MLFLVLFTLVITIVYFFLKLNYQYWEKRGVKGPKPTLLIGNLGKSVIFQEHLGNIYTNIYNKHKGEEIVGIYRGITPTLLLCDPDAIKEITVKSFSSFHDNDVYLDKKHDPIFGKNPFFLKGEEWKIVRQQFTSGHTSGKMKWMYPFLEEQSRELVKFLSKQPEATNGQGYEAKELSVRFTLNNVASCAFGLEGKCFQEENSEFRQLSRDFFSPEGWSLFAFTLSFLFPSIGKILPFRIVPKHIERKLLNMVVDTLKYREENNIVRNDFLHITSQFKKTCKEYNFTDLDVTAAAAGFFGDGSETSSIVMSWTLFEIAANPDVQRRLREEVNVGFGDKNELSYDDLQGMVYLDAIIDETLRLRTPFPFLQKVCTTSTTFTPKNGTKPFVIKVGTPIILPVRGFHHDEKYYEEPKTFKPERFLAHNKEKLTKYTFLAFGEGPRACLGKRFGLLQIKVGLAYIVRNYELSVNKKTQVPIKYTNAPFLTPVGGLWLDFKKIVN